MILFPHGKVNLGLNVTRKRSDGFHEIETVMVPIPLCDVLEAIADPALNNGEIIFTRSGLNIPGALETDLCWRAAKCLENERKLPGLRMHLHKAIPMGAGLGGGSSDGAFTLRLLNDLFDLRIAEDQLQDMATTLGSDCPFFLKKGAQLATGRGELLKPIDLDLTGLHLVLINPGIHVATSEAYGHTSPTGILADIEKLLDRNNIASWQRTVLNTMEPHVFQRYPEVAAVKDKLLEQGAFYAAMSGSGSTVFGLFNSPPRRLNFPSGYGQWAFPL